MKGNDKHRHLTQANGKLELVRNAIEFNLPTVLVNSPMTQNYKPVQDILPRHML